MRAGCSESWNSWAVLLLVGTASCLGSEPPPILARAPERFPFIQTDLAVDGRLDEPAWQRAWRMELRFEVQPGENVPPPVRTEVLAFYDRDALYVAFKAHDPHPGHIRTHLSDRDHIGPDDWVLVILDTFNDERRSFGFMVNPSGVQSDFIESETGTNDAWDAIWESSARITDWGFAVEMEIPFSSLRFQRTGSPQTWGIDAVRSYPRSVRHHIGLFPRRRDNNCYLCQAVKVEGFEEAEAGLNLEVVPTVTATRLDQRSDWPSGPLERGDAEGEAGLTLRWGVTPNMTLAGTVNPDFSQVEADALQSDVNNNFALFLSEKRPFFMDGSDFFETPLQAVYTRTLASPEWGAKLSGKEGPHTLGAYVVRDEVTKLLLPGPEFSQAPGAPLPLVSNAGILRYARDIGRRHGVGALATAREADDYSSLLYGVDARLRFTDKDRITVQYLRSSTDYLETIVSEFDQPAGRLDADALDLHWGHAARYHAFWADFRHVGDDFRADLGFMPQVGMRYAVAGARRSWIAEEGVKSYSQMRVLGEIYRVERQDGGLLDERAWASFEYEGPHQMHSLARLEYGREGFSGRVFDRNKLFLHHCMKPGGHTFFALNAWVEDAVDYQGERQAGLFRFQPRLIQSLGRHFNVDLRYTYETLEIDEGRLYTAQLVSMRAAHQFTAEFFARVTLQHVDYVYGAELYPEGWDSRYRTLLTQVLLSYKVNPRTVFFLGHSDSATGNQRVRLTQTERRFFAKVGYAWTL